MALIGVPWATGNGALNSVELARAGVYNASGGHGGVGDRDAMKVTALPTPGGAVRVQHGTATLINRYPNVFGQAYIVMETDSTDVAIPATGSTGGAVRYVIVRVDDPTQGGQEPPSAEDGPYNRYAVVSSVANLAYPHVVLARIDQPANTGTITNSMITDQRELTNPRTDERWIQRPMIGSENGTTLGATGVAGEQFPDGTGIGVFDLAVPDWAVRAQVEYEWLGVRMSNTDKAVNVWFHWGTPAGGYMGESQRFGYDGETTNVGRQIFKVADWFYVPPALRGGTLRLWPMGRVTFGTQGTVDMDAISGISVKVRFLEVPD